MAALNRFEPLAILALGPTAFPPESLGSRVLTQIGRAVDGAVLQAARLAIDATLMPRADELPGMLATAQPFLTGALRVDPRRYLAVAGEPVELPPQRQRRRRSLRGGTVFARRFSVPYQSYFDAAKRAEDSVHVEHWTHQGAQRRPTILALHGFGMGYPRLDSVALFAPELYRRGFDVALLTLPYHGARTPPGARFSGQRFTAVDVLELNEAVRRAVVEVLAVERWLREQRGDPVGLVGLSLGGYIASLMAGLLPRLDFVVAVVPPVCIGDLAWRFFSRSRHYAGGTPPVAHDELRAAYQVHSPLTYPAVVARERLLILAGRGDQIVPPEHPHALWRHWGEPAIHWFSGSHLAPFQRRALAARIVEHIAATCA
jgi:pimeloyl-ACP methyl ester carboxylesterase